MDGESERFNQRKMNNSTGNSQLAIRNSESFLRWIGTIKKMLQIFFLCLLFHVHVNAQTERKFIRDGNQMYKDKKYSDAEVNYKKSLGANKDSKPAQFNLGDAYYKQGKYEDAAKQFEISSSDKSLDKENQSKAFHNLGNSYLQTKKFPESISAYKNALKLNPKDNETRYNLAYAQSMLQQQQKQQQQDDNKDKNKDQNKDQKKDPNDQKKDQQQKEQKEQQQKADQKKDEEKQAQAQKRDKISKEDAEKILQALNNDEKNTQKKLTKKDATRLSIDKNW
ncbi:tetratricopeptide repeat protein [soil metagenome]